MARCRIITDSGNDVLGNQLDHGRESRIWRRVDVNDGRAFYRTWTVLSDSFGGTYDGICDRTGIVGGRKDSDGPDSAFCTFSVVGNGGSRMVIEKRRGFLHKRAGGYMTVEASFLVSWTIFIFVLLIYLSFYTYDKCVLFQDAYAVCFRGSIQKDEDNVVPYISAHIQEQFGRKYFGTGEVCGSVDRNGHTAYVTGECQVKVPVRSLFTMYEKDGWKIRTQARAQIINPTHIIRKGRWVDNMFAQ